MDTLAVYIPDKTYGQDDYDTWQERSTEFRVELEKEFGLPIQDADIWPGASLPAFLMHVPIDAWPYLGMALYAFFKGKDVEDNLDAWPKLFDRLNPFRKHRAYFKRDGAAVLVIHEITKALGSEPRSIRLIGYVLHTDVTGGPPDLNAISEISDDPEEHYVGWVEHLFVVEADGRQFKAIVWRRSYLVGGCGAVGAAQKLSEDTISGAIQRERNMKHWPRSWKVPLILAMNPEWDNLYETINR